MKTALLLLAIAIAAVVYAENQPDKARTCEQCGARMEPLPNFPGIYRCTGCEFAMDTN